MASGDLSGQTIGQYELRQLYASGGMGDIYRAYQKGLDREVALKVIMTKHAQDETYVERFAREARLAASLDHPNIVPVFDFGSAGDIIYLTMRLLTGGSLAERIKQRTDHPPSLGEISELLRQLASALDYAHSRGVIHRDIKANNVMFDNHGNAYLVDFGIAKAFREGQQNITGSGEIMGTPTHMAPEQWKGLPATAQSDQYALGIMTYHMITGRVPFEAETPYALMTGHLNDMPTPPQVFRKDVPPAVSAVLERALAKEPEKRFETVTAFYNAFIGASEGAPTGADNLFTFKFTLPTPTPMHVSGSEDVTYTPSAAAKRQFPPTPVSSPDEKTTYAQSAGVATRKRKFPAGLWIGGILALIIIAALAGLFVLRNSQDNTPLATTLVDLPARLGPASDYAEIATLSEGEDYEITGISDDEAWYQIRLRNGDYAWIPASLSMVEIEGDFEEVQVAFAPSLTPTQIPPTETLTPIPPTETLTPIPPSATATPTPIPPSATATSIPPSATATAVPPSETPTVIPPSLTPTQGESAAIAALRPVEVANMQTISGKVTLLGSTVFRIGPGNDFANVTTLREGTFPIVGRVSNPEEWYLVDIGDQELWLSANARFAVFKLAEEELTVSQGPLAYGDSVDSDLPSNGQAEFTFEGKAGDIISLAVTVASFDTQLELYGENSPLPIAQDDDSGGNLNPLINGFTLPSDGAYRVLVRAYAPTAEGSFRLILVEGEYAEPLLGNTIAFGQTITAPLTSNAEAVYSFKATEGDTISVQVAAGFDTFLQILASDDRVLASDDDSGGELNPLIEFFQIPNTGEYNIVVRGYSSNNVGTYQLTLRKAFGANTTSISYGETFSGVLNEERVAVFTFAGTANDRITIKVEGDFDSKVELFDPIGKLLVEDDDSGEDLQPLIEDFVLPDSGDFVIRVTGFSEEEGGTFTITLDGESTP